MNLIRAMAIIGATVLPLATLGARAATITHRALEVERKKALRAAIDLQDYQADEREGDQP